VGLIQAATKHLQRKTYPNLQAKVLGEKADYPLHINSIRKIVC
jgi:hypothetical protein